MTLKTVNAQHIYSYDASELNPIVTIHVKEVVAAVEVFNMMV